MNGLDRFLSAQERVWPQVEAELSAGAKTSHWMWFIFPQIAGLGRSETARFYAIRDIDEARAYLAHPVLAGRLRRAAALMLTHREARTAENILGLVDAAKLRSSMTLFEIADPGEALWGEVLDVFAAGGRCERTIAAVTPAT